MLTLENLTFQRGSFALSANWSLDAGARVAVIGPSGGGKSTLLSLIAGFDLPASGRVKIGDTDQTGIAPGDRPMSILFQESNLFPHLTVTQNVGLGIDPGLRLGAEDKDRVNGVLVQVGLEGMGARKPGALSGGQRARAALARVLLRDRPLLLLDEAFSALGPALKDEMFTLLETTIAAETTLLMVTHDPAEAARMDLIVVVDNATASPPEASGPLLADPPPGLRAYLGAG